METWAVVKENVSIVDKCHWPLFNLKLFFPVSTNIHYIYKTKNISVLLFLTR